MIQYHARCETFNLPHPLQLTDNHSITGIDETSRATGVVVMQFPFKALAVMIDVAFSVFKEGISTLFLIRDNLDKGLKISKQG